MSVQDTISMLSKRASREATAPRYSANELRLLALEMEKRAILGTIAGGIARAATLPLRAVAGVGTLFGKTLGGVAKGTGAGLLGTTGALLGGSAAGPVGAVAGGVGGKALSKAPALLARLASETAALPFDHPGKFVTWGPALGFSALELSHRMRGTRALGEAAERAATSTAYRGPRGW